MPEATRARPDVRRGHRTRPFAERGHRVIEPRLTRHHELRSNVPQPVGEPLPIAAFAQDLMEAITSHDTVVLRGGTGSGKSTLGPAIFLEVLQKAHPEKKVKMIVAEPRQFLAEEISDRVATLNNVPLGGDLVGYYHGDGQNYSKDNTQIVYTVSGSLRKRIEEDKSLAAYDAVFLDEIHLRDVDQEAILIGLKEVQKERARKGLAPLKIVIASASADQKYADYYGNAVLKEVKGQEPKHKVDKHFAETSIDRENIPLEMGKLAAKLIKDPKNRGDVVGFLPGRREIQIAIAEFNRIMEEEGLKDKYMCAAFTGGGGKENKELQRILNDKNPEREPVVAFATDVAEAGATFPRLTKVIDSGLLRTVLYNIETGLASLRTIPHAVVHYIQRLGRLGRNGAGDFYALYTEAELNDETIHPKEALPSVLKEDLTPLVLSLKKMGIIDVYAVDYLDHPGKEKLDQAVETLTILGALNEDGTLTDEGKEMAELPVDPHFARMLVEAKKLGCVDAISTLVGFLNSPKPVFSYSREERFNQKYDQYINHSSDFLTLLNVWNAYVATPREQRRDWAQLHGFDTRVLYDARTTKNDLVSEKLFEGLGLDREDKAFNLADENVLLQIQKCVLAGLAGWLLIRQGNTYAFQDGRKTGIEIGRASGLFGQLPELIVSANIRSPEGLGRTFAEINGTMDYALVEEMAPQLAFVRAQREQLAASNAAAEAAEIERQQLEAAEAAANTEAERNASQGTQENTDNNSGTTETPEPPRKLSFGERLKAAAVNIKNAIAGALQKVRQTIASIWGNIKKFFGRR